LATPLEPAPRGLAPGRVFLKREDVHELGAFKWRGALPVLRGYRDAGAEAVVTASTGNHGAATAWAAESRLGRTSATYEYCAHRSDDDTLLVTARQTLVHVDVDERRAQRIPQAYRDRIREFEGDDVEVATARAPAR
jgi:threonine synthase